MTNTVDFDYIAGLLESFLDNFNNDSRKINSKYIRRIIKNWGKKDLMLDEKGMVTNEYAIKDLHKIISDLFEAFPANKEYILLLKSSFETKKSLSDKTFTKHLIVLTVCKEIYFYYKAKNKNKKDDEITVFSKLTLSLLDNYHGFLFSYLSGDLLTVMQKVRIIYEEFIIFRFIYKNKELSKPFLDHKEVIKYNITKDILKDEINDKEYSALITEYGEDFCDNYGWTKNVIQNRNDRKLSYIANVLGVDENINTMYKITSNLIHTS